MPVRNQRNLEPATRLDEHLLELYRRSRAEEFGIAAPSFAAMLYKLAAKNIPEAPKSHRLNFFYSLHLEKLPVPRAYAGGNERAWQVFMLRFREKLYDAGRQI